MLSVFPSLLSWSQISPLLIRLALAAVFLHRSYRGFRDSRAPSRDKAVAIVEAVSGILLVIGLWTQVAALAIAIDLVIRLVDRAGKRALLTDGVNYYLILLVLSLSVIVTGAGFLAFDYPL